MLPGDCYLHTYVLGSVLNLAMSQDDVANMALTELSSAPPNQTHTATATR